MIIFLYAGRDCNKSLTKRAGLQSGWAQAYCLLDLRDKRIRSPRNSELSNKNEHYSNIILTQGILTQVSDTN